MNTNREIDANIVIEVLQKRIGQLVAQYETEIAIRDAIIQENQNPTEED